MASLPRESGQAEQSVPGKHSMQHGPKAGRPQRAVSWRAHLVKLLATLYLGGEPFERGVPAASKKTFKVTIDFTVFLQCSRHTARHCFESS